MTVPLVLIAWLLLAGTALAQDAALVPVTVDGQSVRLQMRIYKPPAPGPAPTLVFNHGSTGSGTNPAIMVRPIDFPVLAEFFVQRGWAVVMPARRGRGGILSVAYAGAHPEQVRGVINFVGGWSGRRCLDYAVTNGTLFRRGAAYPGPTLWLYGEDDPFYSLQHSRGNFAAFQAAGGLGAFHEFPGPPGSTGHEISRHPGIWWLVVESYLDQLRLPARRN